MSNSGCLRQIDTTGKLRITAMRNLPVGQISLVAAAG
jgi:hypothetical protein